MPSFTINMRRTVALEQQVLVAAENEEEAHELASRLDIEHVLTSEEVCSVEVWPDRDSIEPLDVGPDSERLIKLRAALGQTMERVDVLWTLLHEHAKNSAVLGTLDLALLGTNRTLALLNKAIDWERKRA
jgi:hypothetical protein